MQDMVTQRLLSDEYITCAVIDERKGDVLNAVQQALGILNTSESGKVGACLIVMQLVANVKSPNVPGPWFEEIIVTVRVLENRLINDADGGTGIRALTFCKRVAMALHHFSVNGLFGTLVCDYPTVVPVSDPVAPLAYEVRFKTGEANRAAVLKVAQPTFVADVTQLYATVTGACATGGATIYYCFDEGYPRAGQDGVSHNVPVVVKGNYMNAVGRLTGYIESDVVRKIFNYTTAPTPTIVTAGSGGCTVSWTPTGVTEMALVTLDGTDPELGLDGATPNGTGPNPNPLTLLGLPLGLVVKVKLYATNMIPSAIASFTVI